MITYFPYTNPRMLRYVRNIQLVKVTTVKITNILPTVINVV